MFTTEDVEAIADWEANLKHFLAQYSLRPDKNSPGRGYAKKTQQTYESWLRPWVEYLRRLGNPRNPTNMQLKEFLFGKHGHNPKNHNRIGK